MTTTALPDSDAAAAVEQSSKGRSSSLTDEPANE
jgi:hypothetical protein